MNQIPTAIVFIFAFFLMMLVMKVNAYLSGWTRLTARYQTDIPEPAGAKRPIIASIGHGNYGFLFKVAATPSGLYMSPALWLRFAFSPALISWSKMHDRKTVRGIGPEWVSAYDQFHVAILNAKPVRIRLSRSFTRLVEDKLPPPAEPTTPARAIA